MQLRLGLQLACFLVSQYAVEVNEHVCKGTQQNLGLMLSRVRGNVKLLFRVYYTAMLVLSMHSLPPCCDDRPKLFSDLKHVLELLHSLHLLCGLMWAAEESSFGRCNLLDPHDSFKLVVGSPPADSELSRCLSSAGSNFTRFGEDCDWICSICRCDRALSCKLAPKPASTGPITSSGVIDLPQVLCDSIAETESPCGVSRFQTAYVTAERYDEHPRGASRCCLERCNGSCCQRICPASHRQKNWHTTPQLSSKTVW